MNLPSFIARRYLFARRRKTIITIISWISLAGIAVGSAALVVVLSVYNGIGQLTQGLFNVFDPELVVAPVEGKSFRCATIDYEAVCHTAGVTAVSQVVEENAWVTNGSLEAIVSLRGVDTAYATLTGLDTLLYEGQYVLQREGQYFVLLGSQLYRSLGASLYSNTPVAVHIPKRGGGIGLTMAQAFNTAYAYPAGYFFLQQDIDSRYVVCDIDMARSLLGYAPDEVSFLAVTVTASRRVDRVKTELQELLGPSFTVKDRFEQQPLYYKVFRSERLGVYLILSLIVLIATLNLIASLSLLMIDKRRDVKILISMGMERMDVRRIFWVEGELIAAMGTLAGLLVGLIICLLQQQFGIVKMGTDNLITDAFPVAMRGVDFLNTFLLVMVLATLSVWLTVRHSRLSDDDR